MKKSIAVTGVALLTLSLNASGKASSRAEKVPANGRVAVDSKAKALFDKAQKAGVKVQKASAAMPHSCIERCDKIRN